MVIVGDSCQGYMHCDTIFVTIVQKCSKRAFARAYHTAAELLLYSLSITVSLHEFLIKPFKTCNFEP